MTQPSDAPEQNPYSSDDSIPGTFPKRRARPFWGGIVAGVLWTLFSYNLIGGEVTWLDVGDGLPTWSIPHPIGLAWYVFCIFAGVMIIVVSLTNWGFRKKTLLIIPLLYLVVALLG